MNYTHDLQAFLARYFPTFICTFFLAVFSISSAIALVSSAWFREHPNGANYTLIAALSLTVVLCFATFMMIRGRTWAVWIIVALFLTSLFVVLPTYGFRTHLFIYSLGVLFPLLGLLMLNSKRHREMRKALVGIRQERIKARRG